jgi:ADP-ribosylglycohydrolase
MTRSARLARAWTALEGLALGDALGSQFFVPENSPYYDAQSLPPGPWQWTDDTEMACGVAAVLAAHGRIDQDALLAEFVERHDFYRGYGPGTNRLLRLVRDGGDWRRLTRESFDGGSWGNGGAMRVAPLGAYFADDPERAAHEAALSAEVTHAHPQGIAGTVAIAVAAATAASSAELGRPEFFEPVLALTPAGEVSDAIGHARDLAHLDDPRSAAAILGNGREISALDTVPFCLWVAARHLDGAAPGAYATAVWETTRAGGDIDTTCAIVGGIVAARVGIDGIPADWLSRREALPEWLTALAPVGG